MCGKVYEITLDTRSSGLGTDSVLIIPNERDYELHISHHVRALRKLVRENIQNNTMNESLLINLKMKIFRAIKQLGAKFNDILLELNRVISMEEKYDSLLTNDITDVPKITSMQGQDAYILLGIINDIINI